MKCSYIDIHTHHNTTATTISTIGLHPWQAISGELPSREEVEVADAVGEIGLDYACDVDKRQQQLIFEQQLDLAEEFGKPVVLHCVRAFDAVMQCLQKRRLAAVIFHGFIGSQEQAEQAVKRGYYLSFGTRTARSKKTIRALRTTPLERLFVESDDVPAPIAELYQTIAELHGVTTEELRLATMENYKRIFEDKNG